MRKIDKFLDAEAKVGDIVVNDLSGETSEVIAIINRNLDEKGAANFDVTPILIGNNVVLRGLLSKAFGKVHEWEITKPRSKNDAEITKTSDVSEIQD